MADDAPPAPRVDASREPPQQAANTAGSVRELVQQLDGLPLLSEDPSAVRSQKLARRVELAHALSAALESSEVDIGTSVVAARALRYVSSTGTAFIELAQELAKAAWVGGHPDGAELYASTTDLLRNRQHRPQCFGTLTHVRHGEKVLQPVDPDVSDQERRALGLAALEDIAAGIAAENRRRAEDLARTTGLPEGAEVRRVWRPEDSADLAVLSRELGPVWREGDELVFVWETKAAEVALSGGLQLPLWRLPGCDVWGARLRIRDLDRAIVSYGFLGRDNSDGPVRFLGGDGCWRGPQAPPEPSRNQPMAGSLREVDLAGPRPGERRSITAYLPPGHDPRRTYPVVYLTDGGMTGSLAEVLDAAIVEGNAPEVLLVGVASGVEPGGDLRNDEYIVGRHPERFEVHRSFFVDMVARWAQSELGADSRREHRFLFGVSSGAAFAVTMGLRHPDRFGGVLAFSLGVVPVDNVASPTADVPAHYLVAGTLEEGFQRSTASWAAHVRGAGGRCTHVELVSGHDYRMWETQFPIAVGWAAR